MTSAKEDIIFQVAQRLQIDAVTVKKAEAFHRILASKDSTRSINCTTKAVLCLDIATSQSGAAFNKESAIKLSGVKKSIYQNHLNNVESILQLNRCLTVSAICVKMSCTDVRTFAEDILDKYQLHNIQMDFNHSQYPSVAVYTACKWKGIKVHRREFVTLSKLKLNAWKDLETEFSNFMNKIGLKASADKTNNSEFYKSLVKQDVDDHTDQSQKQNSLEDNADTEEYEVWKKRILEEARRQLQIVRE